MHAWVMAWCGDEAGWIGLDPTNAMLAGNDHLVLAVGRDYADVAPVDGVIVASGGQRIEVAVQVIPLPAGHCRARSGVGRLISSPLKLSIGHRCFQREARRPRWCAPSPHAKRGGEGRDGGRVHLAPPELGAPPPPPRYFFPPPHRFAGGGVVPPRQ